MAGEPPTSHELAVAPTNVAAHSATAPAALNLPKTPFLDDDGHPIRWLLNEEKYREALRSQPPRWFELGHIFLSLESGGDAWIVSDPSDRLGDQIGHDGFVANIPRPVWRIDKLSKNHDVVYDDDKFDCSYCPHHV